MVATANPSPSLDDLPPVPLTAREWVRLAGALASLLFLVVVYDVEYAVRRLVLPRRRFV